MSLSTGRFRRLGATLTLTAAVATITAPTTLANHQDGDTKTALQELAQGRGLPLPEYSVVDEVGPDHSKTFVVEVKVGSHVSRGEGSSKKEAQQQAAKHALRDQPG